MPLNVCFVTGTRAEYGLMATVLAKIESHKKLRLQVIATGMHLDKRRGQTLLGIRRPNCVVPWPASDSPRESAISTGHAIAGLAKAYHKLKTDIVLVVGDRVEAFAAASAAHISGIPVAHVHGGDRAAGQIDDSLRHAITKLSHIHFPATATSEKRILKLGEDAWRVHRAGSPGIDGIHEAVEGRSEFNAGVAPFALVLLHPVDSRPDVERKRAKLVLRAVEKSGIPRAIIIYPNNDPGSDGICDAWEKFPPGRHIVARNLGRNEFLRAMRDAVALLGNSSSGIIEAASFGTPVVDVGPRQQGREHGKNVVHVGYSEAEICKAVSRIWNRGNPKRFASDNVYGGGNTGQIIANVLAKVSLDNALLRKLIAY